MTSMPVAGVRAGAPARPADLVLRNAKIFTGDPKQPAATALAVRNDSVTVVGGDREAAALAGPRTRVIDTLGHRVVPGPNDSRNHVVRGGLHFVLTVVGGRVVHAVGFFEGLAPAAPLVQPDWSPIAHFGGHQAGHGCGRCGPRQADGVQDAAASAGHLRWRQRTGRATDGHRPLDTFDPCFS
jgi:hypothetical protein